MITFILTEEQTHYLDEWLQQEKGVTMGPFSFPRSGGWYQKYTALDGRITFTQEEGNWGFWKICFDDSLRDWAILGRLST